MTGRPPDWDASTYHRVSTPQLAWGRKVLARLPLRGDETVLDAGCGTGRLTAELLERLPHGKVIALDSSPGMLEQARAHLLPRSHPRVELLLADLADLQLGPVADVVFSTATFHWIQDHDRLFRGLYRALRPGGRLWAQCGGGDNLGRLHQRAAALMQAPPFAPHFAGWTDPWHFATAADTRARLLRAGFEELQVWLEEAPTPFPDAAAFAEFTRAVVLRHHLARLPDEALRAQFLERLTRQAAGDLPPYTLDYWRLNLQATRPPRSAG